MALGRNLYFIEKHLRILSRQQQFFLFGSPILARPLRKHPAAVILGPRGFAPAGDKIADRWAALNILKIEFEIWFIHKARVLILPETTWN